MISKKIYLIIVFFLVGIIVLAFLIMICLYSKKDNYTPSCVKLYDNCLSNTNCCQGSTCVKKNDYYAQCKPVPSSSCKPLYSPCSASSDNHCCDNEKNECAETNDHSFQCRPKTVTPTASTLLYKTEFQNNSESDFTRFNPCLQNYLHEGNLSNYHIIPSGISITFPSNQSGVQDIFYCRIGGQAYSWCDFPIQECCSKTKPCCPPVGNKTKGRFEYWIYFPPTDSSKKNDIHSNDIDCIYPFYKGGKLPGICSGKCPTGNSKDNPDYNNGWTLRLMFRQGGRLALLYSGPQNGMSLEPVPLELKHCFSSDPHSISTDQYWFCTTDPKYSTSGYRLAQYTFSSNSEDNVSKKCATPTVWIDANGNSINNPITPILEAGKWNFLRVQFDVENKRVQVYHTTGGSDPQSIPNYSPTEGKIVLDTQKNAIPFVTSGPITEIYWQPFFGGNDSSWYPGCYDENAKETKTGCNPTFVFSNFFLYSDWK